VSKFYLIWCVVAKNQSFEESFWVGRTYLAILLNISIKVGHIRSKVGHVHRTVFSPIT
jgi:hypothetical protein